jgi:predicted lipoprotein with Yx(FWY)xxD motif
MELKTALGAGIVGLAVVAGGVYLLNQHKATETSSPIVARLSTPPGITFQKVKIGKVTMIPGSSSDQQEQVTVYATDKGMTLYTFDKDTTPGKSACTGDECAKAWPAAAAPADAKPVDDWTVITRDDGSKQWAFKGKPLYTFVKDQKMGDGTGDGVANVWHMALLKPADGMDLPYGINVAEVNEANGQTLVESHGMALYAYDGSVADGKVTCADGPCGPEWKPVLAGQLANNMGDFSVVSRADGVEQWAYKGHPLFSYSGDLELGDANGTGVDKHFQIAEVERYYIPAEVKIIPNERKGGLMADLNGKTLYARDRVRFDGTGGHAARGADRGIPAMGMAIGVTGCDADCAKDWHPLIAAADAKPSGYWALMKRDDGSMQWAYQGYAVYTYSGDKKPGDMVGQDTYALMVSDGDKVVDPRHGMGLYWRVVAP